MRNSWEAALDHTFAEAFGDAARQAVDGRTQRRDFYSAHDIERHLRLADQVFETIALTIHQASHDGDINPSSSKLVTENLLAQIAQDLKAVGLLVRSGFPYQAVTVAVSIFEHGMMAASIGDNDQRAQKWLDHDEESRNIDKVNTLVKLALETIEQRNRGISARLGDLYDGIYKPLCAFKHGNPVVQQHMHHEVDQGLPMSIFADDRRRSILAAYWAVEAAVRSAWMALVVFIERHVQDPQKVSEIVGGLNRSLNTIKDIRKKKEREPN